MAACSESAPHRKTPLIPAPGSDLRSARGQAPAGIQDFSPPAGAQSRPDRTFTLTDIPADAVWQGLAGRGFTRGAVRQWTIFANHIVEPFLGSGVFAVVQRFAAIVVHFLDTLAPLLLALLLFLFPFARFLFSVALFLLAPSKE